MGLLLATEPLEIVTPRILVCDDNGAGRALLKRMLMRRGYFVDEAKDGRSTIETIERCAPDLVLLDLHMPDIDGAEVLRHLRCFYDANTLPIIMVSAEHDGEVVAGCLSLGASDYVTKPVHPDVLYARIATHLDLHFAQIYLTPEIMHPALRLVH